MSKHHVNIALKRNKYWLTVSNNTILSNIKRATTTTEESSVQETNIDDNYVAVIVINISHPVF